VNGGLRSAATARLVHTVGDTLTVHAAGTEILRYHYRPELHPTECPSPYAHPLRTLAGRIVTGNRPHDHRWHRGLAMTASHLSGQNFWGGGSAVHGTPGYGYAGLSGVGRMDHTGFTALAAGGRTAFTETVDWITAGGERWIAEERSWEVRDLDPNGGSWTLEFSTALLNVRGEALRFGSPAVFGRELAGHCGLFWRGPRDFTGGALATPKGSGEDVMGSRAPWLAFTGEFDGDDAHATLVFHADPQLPGGDPHWFVRSEPYPAVNPSLAFHDELPLADGAVLRLAYRLVIADGVWDRDRIVAHLADHPW
jgi:Methane oxygenase PmoA